MKAETHNHPSAIEPFGGANTGVGGVIRDVMGAAHHPIAVTDILCFGPTDLPADQLPDGVLHPRLIESGVIAGVADYGNKIGLPTVAGAVLYDPGYTANPLVFCRLHRRRRRDRRRCPARSPATWWWSSAAAPAATACAAPRSAAPPWTPPPARWPAPACRSATRSSRSWSSTPCAECHGLYTAVTDCGAGGLSSAVGEMAEGVGADVDVTLAPLKYPGLRPWEIWLSEAQERMVFAVPPATLAGHARRVRPPRRRGRRPRHVHRRRPAARARTATSPCSNSTPTSCTTAARSAR